MPLAINSYEEVKTLADGTGLLNLSWTLDESQFLAIDLPALVTGCLQQEISAALPWSRQYFVKDPYGATTLGAAVEKFFACSGLAGNVSCGAGVNALLHALARACHGKAVLLTDGIYPDFPHWVAQCGGRLTVMPRSAELGAWRSALDELGEAVIFLERPSFLDEPRFGRSELLELCACAARRGALVLVDESNANYCPPAYSAVPLTLEAHNLVVLRGFAKAYGLGSIRAALCISAAACTRQIRALLPPLQVSSLSLFIARTVLEHGDLAAPLRARIHTMRQRMMAGLEAAGITGLPACSPFLPYVLFSDAERLARRNIVIKRHPLWSASAQISYVYRGSIPLSEERMALFERSLTA